MNEPDIDPVRPHLDRLERRLRRWIVLASVAWAVVVVGLAVNVFYVIRLSEELGAPEDETGSTAEAEEQVIAKRFVLVDEDGRPRAALAIRADGSPSLAFSDTDGKVIWKAPPR